MMKTLLNMGGGANLTTRNDDGTFTTTANYSSSRNKGTKLTGLKDNTDYTVSLDIININSTGNKNAEIEILENLDNGSRIAVLQKTVNAGINTMEFNSKSYQDLSLHISGFTSSGNTISTTFKDVQVAEKSNDNTYIEHEEQLITFPLKENQKMYKDSYLAEDGIHHKRKQIELDGTEDWVLSGSIANNQYILNIPDIKMIGENSKGNLISSHFKEITGVEGYQNNNINGISGWSIKQIRISLDINIVNRNVTEFKNLLAQQKQAGTPVTVEYPIAEEIIEPYIETQQEVHNQLQNVTPYELVTNVFTDKAKLQFNYIADTKTYIDNKVTNMQKQLNTINELLSTANTSAMLLDNLQTDLESEVL